MSKKSIRTTFQIIWGLSQLIRFLILFYRRSKREAGRQNKWTKVQEYLKLDKILNCHQILQSPIPLTKSSVNIVESNTPQVDWRRIRRSAVRYHLIIGKRQDHQMFQKDRHIFQLDRKMFRLDRKMSQLDRKIWSKNIKSPRMSDQFNLKTKRITKKLISCKLNRLN
jgi:hypothetical protein